MRRELGFVYDYGQVYLYDAATSSVDYLAALDAATANRLTVGVEIGRASCRERVLPTV